MFTPALLSSGLSLSNFHGVLPSGAYALLAELPLPLSPMVSGLAVLRALHQIAYEDVWKPRCTAVIALERIRGAMSSLNC